MIAIHRTTDGERLALCFTVDKARALAEPFTCPVAFIDTDDAEARALLAESKRLQRAIRLAQIAEMRREAA